MSAFKGTPGPWGEGPQGIRHGEGFIAFPCAPREVADAMQEGESWVDMRRRTQAARDAIVSEQKANARLIAAAPDLLEALRYAIEQVPELATVPGIASAIAKAIGEQA